MSSLIFRRAGPLVTLLFATMLVATPVTFAQAPADQPGLTPGVTQPAPSVAAMDDDSGYWGLLGLFGLVGLAGLMRRDRPRSVERPGERVAR